jgi:hypothetical protein
MYVNHEGTPLEVGLMNILMTLINNYVITHRSVDIIIIETEECDVKTTECR